MTNLQYRSLRNWKYQTTKYHTDIETGIRATEEGIETDFLYIGPKGILNIKEFYAWDGATGFPDLKTIMYPSLVHDALCQLIKDGHLNYDKHRKPADQLLRELCIKEGMPKWLATVVYVGVRLYALSKRIF